MVIPDLNTTGLLSLGVFGSLAMGILYSLKSIPGKILKKVKQHYIFSVIIYDYDELFYVLENWLYKNHQRKYKSVEASYVETPDYYIKVDDEEQEGNIKKGTRSILYKQDVNIFILKYGNKRLVFNKSKEKIESIKDTKKLYSYHYNISGFRAKNQIKSILEEITTEYNKSKEDKRVKIYTSSWGNWSLHSKRSVKPLRDTILNKNDKDFLISDINKFQGSKDWYRDVNIMYKRTYLLYGPPGTGKTTLSFAIASETERPLYVLSLASISSDENLINLFSDIAKGSILLMEDIDAAFTKRKGDKVSFSCLLNCIDGAFSKDDIITIMTTNHIEKLDPALLRPGRVDVKMEIPKATEKEISEFLSIFYQKPITINHPLMAPMSTIQEICIRNTDNHELAINQIMKEYEQ